MVEINHEFKRPPSEMVALFSFMPTTILSDAMGRKGAMSNYIKPVNPSMRLVGPAFTVKAPPADNLMCHLAIKLAQPGDVIVVDAGGFCDIALWGELMSLNAQMRKLGGLVIDGAVRDQNGISNIGFPVFARGTVPAGPFKNKLGDIGVPIACGGVSVHPGDLLVGDSDGVIVIPLSDIEDIFQQAIAIKAQEEILRTKILNGQTLFELLNLDDQFDDYDFSLRS